MFSWRKWDIGSFSVEVGRSTSPGFKPEERKRDGVSVRSSFMRPRWKFRLGLKVTTNEVEKE